MKKYTPIDLFPIDTYSIATRDNKVNVGEQFAKASQACGSLADFYNSLPRLHGADSLRVVVDAVVVAREKWRPVVLAMEGRYNYALQPAFNALN
jgi:hypothetical protein